jgi:ribosomal protein S7
MKNIKTIEKTLVGCLTKRGKKQISKKIVYASLLDSSRKLKLSLVQILRKLSSRLGLIFEIRNVKIRRNIHTVPSPITTKRRGYLVVKRLLKALETDRTKRPVTEKLTEQIINVVLKKNTYTIADRKSIVQNAVRNRSNVHYRW